ncbi:MAG: hypothetical protein KF761_05440 [Salinibacterium sp.]|nr:hypothetical protein [Salinibacterium sp.]
MDDIWGEGSTTKRLAVEDDAATDLTYEPDDLRESPPKIERSAAERAAAGPTQATELVQLARSRYEIVRGDDGKIYAVARDLPGVAFNLRGGTGLKPKLQADYYDDKHKAAAGGSVQDALGVLEGDALRAGETPIHLRTGRHNGDVIIDRGTPSGAAIRIAPSGWTLLGNSPILFRRSGISREMTSPTTGGNLDPLRAILNVSESDFRLVVAYIVAALIPEIAHPIMALLGQQGVAKSTAARIVLSFIDPSAAGLGSQPHNPDAWAVSAYNAYALGLDNVSHMLPWLQDALCKAVTGDSVVRRQLYSDHDVIALAFRRVIILTSIDPGSLQGDVADRLLTINLDPIAPTDRRTESELQSVLDTWRPAIQGAIFDLLSDVLRIMPTLDLVEKPRMADWGLVLAAVDEARGWTTLTDYIASAQTAARDVVEGDAFAAAVVNLAHRRGRWTGTAGELLATLSEDKTARGWPTTPRGAQGKLMRMTQAFAAAGVEVHQSKRSNRGTLYTIRMVDAKLCAQCGLEMAETLTVSGASTHPNCED